MVPWQRVPLGRPAQGPVVVYSNIKNRSVCWIFTTGVIFLWIKLGRRPVGTRADVSGGGTPAGTVQAAAESLRSPCWRGEKNRNFPAVDFLCPESPEHFRLTRTIIPSSLEAFWGLGAYFFWSPD